MFERFRQLIDKRRQGPAQAERGQSLVEMAVIVPLLLFMFLGLIEVGWAIRGYLVLLATNRETARFAARGEYLDFGGIIEGPTTPSSLERLVGYDVIVNHTRNILANNGLGVDLVDEDGNPLLQPLGQATGGAFHITHFFIDTGLPCDPDELDMSGGGNGTCLLNACGAGGGTCDCSNPADRKTDYVEDDLILIPSMYGYNHFTYTIPFSNSYVSQIDLIQTARDFKEENDILNCNVQRRDPGEEDIISSVNSLIVIEAFYDQPQLLGVPFLSNTFTDPIPLYIQTKMRITSDSLPQGQGCELMPIGIPESILPDTTPLGTQINNLRPVPGAASEFVWVRWRQTGTSPSEGVSVDSLEYLGAMIKNNRLAIHEYQNGTDEVLDTTNSVWVTPGITFAEPISSTLANYAGRSFVVPVVANAGAERSIHRFARIRLRKVVLNQPSPADDHIEITLEQWDDGPLDPTKPVNTDPDDPDYNPLVRSFCPTQSVTTGNKLPPPP